MLSYDVILWLKRLPHALLLAGVVAAAPLARRGRIPWVRWTSYRECPVAMADGHSPASGSASEQGELQGSVGRSSRGARSRSRSRDRQWDLCQECTDILGTTHITEWIRECDKPTEMICIIRVAAERLEQMW